MSYARQEGVDPLLVAAVTRVESKFYPGARSDQGARGLMQLMPDTARLAAGHLGLPYDPEKLFNPEYNLRLGTWYLAALLREFHDLAPALAAYNGGRGNVHNWLERGVWDGSSRNLRQIPFPETRAFVRQVLQNYRIYRFLYPGAGEQVFGSGSRII
ncbi:MAG: soluble lytic murein transglycosylase [Clostridia bacterium]|nr:soluble lytic murein transglycosylase [Clostridia bacterium]